MWEPDPDTVRRARRREVEAFEELVRAYLGHVYRLALHLVRDPFLAEDVTQEALIRAFRSIGSFRGRSKFSTWLYRITRNCAIDALRGGSRRERLATRAEPPAAAPDPSLRASLNAAIDALAPELRESFILIEVFGLPLKETAGVLGVPEGTLKSRMHRARRLLVAALSTEEDAGEV